MICNILELARLTSHGCHALPWFDLMEPCHVCTHLMTDHDLTQSRHHHAGQCRTVSDPAISDISGHLRCRWENGSMHIPPMETSFGPWNTSLLLQVENPIIGRIFAGNPNIQLFRCLPNRDVISSLNPPNSHDQNGGTYVRIGGLLKEK